MKKNFVELSEHTMNNESNKILYEHSPTFKIARVGDYGCIWSGQLLVDAQIGVHFWFAFSLIFFHLKTR